MMLVVVRMLGEMAVANPHIGTFTEFAREGLGNWAGFTNGWLYWFNWAIIAAIMTASATRTMSCSGRPVIRPNPCFPCR